MVRLFGFALGGRSAAGNGDRARTDEVDHASGSRKSVHRNSLSERNAPGNSSSVGNGKKGKRRRQFEQERKKEEQKGARRKNTFEHRGSLTSSVPQGCRIDMSLFSAGRVLVFYNKPTLP